MGDHSEASSDHSSEEEEGEKSKEYKRVNNSLLRSDDIEVCGYDSGLDIDIDMSLDHKPEDDIELD